MDNNPPKMPEDSAAIEGRSAAAPAPKAGKLRLLTLGHLDGRTAAARRARELIEVIQTDLGGGDRLSEGERQLVQRAAVLGAYIESCEVKWLGGEAVDLADYLAAINAQRRVLATIGLERRARNVTPSVAEYVARMPVDEEAGEE
jgi:glutathione S-transferase